MSSTFSRHDWGPDAGNVSCLDATCPHAVVGKRWPSEVPALRDRLSPHDPGAQQILARPAPTQSSLDSVIMGLALAVAE